MSRIERNPNKCFSRPSLIGSRLTVFDIVTGCYNEGTDNYIRIFNIQKSDAVEALLYCKKLLCQENFKESDQYCAGCVLDTLHSGKDETPMREFEKDGSKFVISEDQKIIFLGDSSEYEEEQFGVMGWIKAEEVIDRDSITTSTD